MKRIDPTCWPRKHHYAWFRGLGFPYLALTSRVRVGCLGLPAQQRPGSPFAWFLHAVSMAANEVPPLRQRIREEAGGDVVIEHPVVDPAFTVEVDGGLFNYTTVAHQADPLAFERTVSKAAAARKSDPILAPFDDLRDDLIYCTCLPWVDFSHIAHPVATQRPDTVPRIAWGKFTKEDGGIQCAVNIQVHHALVDGRHLGEFFRHLQQRLDQLDSSVRARQQ